MCIRDSSVIFGKEVRGKQRVTIEAENGDTSSYLIPKGKHINFNQGEKIKKGEYLLDGQPLPHDILRILGIEELTEYFVNQVQDVYRLQGVIINDKHIETILRQMLKKIEVKETGCITIFSFNCNSLFASNFFAKYHTTIIFSNNCTIFCFSCFK